jgi:23S rRNA (uridine2552-2'-O)-methyltransferase
MRLNEARRDLYRRLAKEQGYKSRAAFKLIEACDKYRFIGEGDYVVDFGSAPGGWLQVASELVGPDGFVAGVDLRPVHMKERNVVSLVMDIHNPQVGEALLRLMGRKADVFLSDVAPSVSGVWELDQGKQADLTLRVLELAPALLKERGTAFCKLFEGERSEEVRRALRNGFERIKANKPAASRSSSSELYYYCEGWKGA